jgi:hypothetical protein
MFKKISRPAPEPVAQSVPIAKAYENQDVRDDRRSEPAKEDLTDMIEAQATCLDAMVQGFAGWGTFRF